VKFKIGHREIENIFENLPDPSKSRTPISSQPHSEPASPVPILPTGWRQKNIDPEAAQQ
jgi:hypothetical protein